MWLAGRFLASHYSVSFKGLAYLVLAVVAGTTVCDLISSGGFYFFSGRFEETTFTEFAGRVIKYLPQYMKTTVIYVAVATAIHFAVLQILNLKPEESTLLK